MKVPEKDLSSPFSQIGAMASTNDSAGINKLDISSSKIAIFPDAPSFFEM